MTGEMFRNTITTKSNCTHRRSDQHVSRPDSAGIVNLNDFFKFAKKSFKAQQTHNDRPTAKVIPRLPSTPNRRCNAIELDFDTLRYDRESRR